MNSNDVQVHSTQTHNACQSAYQSAMQLTKSNSSQINQVSDSSGPLTSLAPSPSFNDELPEHHLRESSIGRGSGVTVAPRQAHGESPYSRLSRLDSRSNLADLLEFGTVSRQPAPVSMVSRRPNTDPRMLHGPSPLSVCGSYTNFTLSCERSTQNAIRTSQSQNVNTEAPESLHRYSIKICSLEGCDMQITEPVPVACLPAASLGRLQRSSAHADLAGFLNTKREEIDPVDSALQLPPRGENVRSSDTLKSKKGFPTAKGYSG